MATSVIRRLTAQQVSHAVITAAMKVPTEPGSGCSRALTRLVCRVVREWWQPSRRPMAAFGPLHFPAERTSLTLKGEKVMQKLSVLFGLLFASLFLISCGAGSGQHLTSTNIEGTWVITAAEEGSGSVFNVTLVSSPCSVVTPIGRFTVQGPACFIADNNTHQGSLSGTGSFIYPPQGVLIGVAADPASTDASMDLLFAEADQFGDAAVFGGTGTVSNGTIAGSWSCNLDSPVCSGLSGTFSGTQK